MQQLQAQGQSVVMVGKSVNAAAALAQVGTRGFATLCAAGGGGQRHAGPLSALPNRQASRALQACLQWEGPCGLHRHACALCRKLPRPAALAYCGAQQPTPPNEYCEMHCLQAPRSMQPLVHLCQTM